MRWRVERRIRPRSRPKRTAYSKGVSPRKSQPGVRRTSRSRETSKTSTPACPAISTWRAWYTPRQNQAAPQLDLHHCPFRAPQVVQVEMVFERPEGQFNGTITNDKFCMSRAGHLQLSWWRLPRSLRLPATRQTSYPTERQEKERESQEDRYEDTSMEHPASSHPNSRWTTEVGSSVSESGPMEPRGSTGPFAGSASTGGKG